MEKLMEALTEGLGNGFARLFEQMGIADEEWRRADMGKGKSELWNMLTPGDTFRDMHVELYRSHVRELIERERRGDDLDYGTRAEVIVGLMVTSLKAPLSQGPSALYHRLFREVMGEKVHEEAILQTQGGRFTPPSPEWEGQLDELEHEARRGVRTGRPKKLTKVDAQESLGI